MNFVTSISLVVLGAMFLALLGWGSIRAAWRNCEGRRGVFAALAILAAICSIVAQKPSPDTPTITVDALLRDVGCYATNDVFHAAVTNAPNYAGVDFSDCDLMVYARERASSDAASWFELTPRKKFSQQPADYAIENATNFDYMVYLNYVPPSPVHTNGVFELYGFVIGNEAQGELDQLAAGFINSSAVPLPFDAEVEYLESTGTQYIDTGVYLSNNHSVEIDYQFTSANQRRTGLFGGLVKTGSSQGRYGGLLSPSNGYLEMGYGEGNVYYQIGVADLNRHTIVQDMSDLYLDGSLIYTFPSSTFSMGATALLLNFRYTNYTPAQCKIYHAKVWLNGVLIRDYIAVRKSGVGYLYDRVSGQLFGNAGTGAFGVGRDK